MYKDEKTLGPFVGDLLRGGIARLEGGDLGETVKVFFVKKSDGKPPKNLELVRVAFAMKQAKPTAKLQWIKAHDGSTWNEYADRLAVSAGRGRVTSVYVAASEAHGGEGD